VTAKLAAARGCNVEVIFKDISTVCHEPSRLWEWSRIASETLQTLSMKEKE